MERLVGYAWPGNIRELQNVDERAVILASSGVLEVERNVLDAEAPPVGVEAAAVESGSAVAASAPAATLDEVERRHIVETLKRCGWVVEGSDGAATRLGLNPSTLRSRMKKFGIRRANEAAS
jgi:formate hydrogenlyase transcriptional activator